MEKTYENDDEIQIDLRELLYALRKKIWLIILAAVIGGGVAGAYSKFIITPQYTSTSMVYVLSKETTLTSLADLQIGSQLTQDYKIIITSRPVLNEIIAELGLNVTYPELKQKIQIGNPQDTRILTIQVQDPDPYRAKTLTDKVAYTSAEYIGEIMEMTPPKIIEDGEIPISKTSPSTKRNAVLGAIVGMVLVCGIVVLRVILNDSIKTEDDVERYLNLSTLAVIPLRGGGAEEYQRHEHKKSTKKSKRSRKRTGGV